MWGDFKRCHAPKRQKRWEKRKKLLAVGKGSRAKKKVILGEGN